MDCAFSDTTHRQNAANSLRRYLIELPRSAKQLVTAGTDVIGLTLCACSAYWLLFGTDLSPGHLALSSLVTVLIAIPLAWSQGLYRSVVRYMGVDLVVAGAKSAAGSAVVGAAYLYIAGLGAAPVRWAVAFWAMAFIYICSSRYFARLFLRRRTRRANRERVIIYGAGSSGARLAIDLLGSEEYLPVAMVDDDLSLRGNKINGINVYASSAIEDLIRDTNATKVLLAMPRAGREKRRQVIERLTDLPVHVQTIPEIKDIVSGRTRVSNIVDVDVEDLLGREPVPPNPTLMSASITGKSVMVTGAGGSIGSELCHQILKLNPLRLILVELSEVALYNIELALGRQLKQFDSDCEIVALLGSVHHEARMREIMQTFEIQTVYHAAAYKHVPIVEHNLFGGIHNNVFGTLHTARAAIQSGVENFVLISTDKAVNPTSVMGATKRMAELILQAYNDQGHKTRVCMVRFGNVLESSGSVVPLFRDQIRCGGPVTVTHREMIRYFMTIPEAAQLVIQAAALARGGDVFVLDMGQPVRISDLAKRMIKLMGLTVRDKSNPEGDIAIEYIGLRPAEKLYEELLIGSNVTGTEHPRIMRADEESIPFDKLHALLGDLQKASEKLDCDPARKILLRAVKEYRPLNGIDDAVWMSKKETRARRSSGTVVDLLSKPA